MAKQNSLTNSSGSLTLDPGSSGDSFLQFDINTTGEFRIGVDDTASDAFKISQGSSIGTNDTFIMTAAGERTLPLQPAFLAYTGTLNNKTGDGTVYQIAFSAEVFDVGSDFATGASAAFTAPVTARYRFSLDVGTGNYFNGSAFTSGYVSIVTSNRTYRNGSVNPFFMANTNSFENYQYHFVFSAMGDMDAADTSHALLTVTGGSKTIDVIQAGATSLRTYFSGEMIL